MESNFKDKHDGQPPNGQLRIEPAPQPRNTGLELFLILIVPHASALLWILAMDWETSKQIDVAFQAATIMWTTGLLSVFMAIGIVAHRRTVWAFAILTFYGCLFGASTVTATVISISKENRYVRSRLSEFSIKQQHLEVYLLFVFAGILAILFGRIYCSETKICIIAPKQFSDDQYEQPNHPIRLRIIDLFTLTTYVALCLLIIPMVGFASRSWIRGLTYILPIGFCQALTWFAYARTLLPGPARSPIRYAWIIFVGSLGAGAASIFANKSDVDDITLGALLVNGSCYFSVAVMRRWGYHWAEIQNEPSGQSDS